MRAHFLCILTSQPMPEELLALSPYLMEWKKNLFIIDLFAVSTYWQKKSQNPLPIWQNFLEEKLKNFDAILCPHPFQGICFFNILKSSFSNQIYNFEKEAKTWQLLKWEHLQEELFILARHWQENKNLESFKLARFHRHVREMDFAISRLQLKKLHEIKAANKEAMHRRFGHEISLIWNWLFKEPEKDPGLFFELCRLQNFPWRQWQKEPQPCIHRYLDQALASWQELEPFLILDWQKLGAELGIHTRLISFSWNITFYSLKSLAVKVHFRKPQKCDDKSLAGFLTQTKIAYEKALDLNFDLKERLDYLADFSIIAWKISFTDTLELQESFAHFLEGENAANERRIEHIENQLHIPLARYRLVADFLPESSFNQLGLSEELCSNELFCIAAKHRPLFYFENKLPLKTAPKAMDLIFLERISLFDHFRDYFLEKCGSKLRWLYRDQNQDWFEQGVYG